MTSGKKFKRERGSWASRGPKYFKSDRSRIRASGRGGKVRKGEVAEKKRGEGGGPSRICLSFPIAVGQVDNDCGGEKGKENPRDKKKKKYSKTAPRCRLPNMNETAACLPTNTSSTGKAQARATAERKGKKGKGIAGNV